MRKNMDNYAKDFDFHWRHGQFEVRSTTGVYGDPYIELVRWRQDSHGKEYCYTIAYWKNNEGFTLYFVGDRMMELAKLDIQDIWPQLCAAQLCLNEWLEAKAREEG